MARDLGINVTEKEDFYFISYNSEDQDRVSTYVKALDKYNLPMWYDKGLHVGEKWEREISRRISNCKAVIMFITKDIFKKEKSYVYKEYVMATEFFLKKIYLVFLDNIQNKEIPLDYISWWIDLQSYQGILAFNCDGAQDCAKKAISAIGLNPLNLSGSVNVDAHEPKPETKKPATGKKTPSTNKGVIQYSDEFYYDGEILDGLPNGYGKMTFDKEHYYEGNFSKGKKHGEGVENFSNGYFKGTWENDERTGKGELFLDGGFVFSGDFSHNLPNGKGKQITPLGTYEGDWVKGKKHGKGVFTNISGEKYVGDFFEDERTGNATLHRLDGSTYKGSFLKGRYDGEGKLTLSNGTVLSGKWKEGVFIN